MNSESKPTNSGRRSLRVLLVFAAMFALLAWPVAELLRTHELSVIQRVTASISIIGSLLNLLTWSATWPEKISSLFGRDKAKAGPAPQFNSSVGPLPSDGLAEKVRREIERRNLR